MVQIKILSGETAGDIQVVRRFPFRIGRAPENDLRLEAAGVWDRHLTLEFEQAQGFTLHTATEAFAAVNEQLCTSTRLRNGDIISFGSAKIQFWLAPAKLRGLRLREAFVWLLLAGATLVQIAILFKLRK